MATCERRLWQIDACFLFLQAMGVGLSLQLEWASAAIGKVTIYYPPNKHLSSITRSVTILMGFAYLFTFWAVLEMWSKVASNLQSFCLNPSLACSNSREGWPLAGIFLVTSCHIFLQFSESAHDSLPTRLRNQAESPHIRLSSCLLFLLSLTPFSFPWLIWRSRNGTLEYQSLRCSRSRTFQSVPSLWDSLKFFSGGRHSSTKYKIIRLSNLSAMKWCISEWLVV